MQSSPLKLPDWFKLRHYQELGVNVALHLIETNPDQWHLFSSPTNTGKSFIELTILSRLPDSVMITPRIEIIVGLLQKLGVRTESLNDQQLTDISWALCRTTTPIRFRNMLILGQLLFRPSVLIIDESHHALAQTYQDINMYLNGVPVIGFTATPYRGTPKETREFHLKWNNIVNEILSLKSAVELGAYQMPNVEIWPLVNDDLIDVATGDFKIRATEAHVKESADLLASNMVRMFDKEVRLWDMPTIITVPGRNAVDMVCSAMRKIGLPCDTVTQETSRFDRINAFESTVQCRVALIQINVVSEGVDLPIRRIIDISPTLSPVKWFQQVGRIRANESGIPPEYICCCRNLERHCYLWEGMLPNSKIIEAQQAFTDDSGKPMYSKRSGTRVVGLEGLGKFTNTPVHLLNGTVGFMYNLVSTENNKRIEYLAYVHPNNVTVTYGSKVSTVDPNTNEMQWGKWRLVDSLPDLKGCISAKVSDLTEPQRVKWYSCAQGLGLNPHREVNSREFKILHFLLNTGLSFK